MTGIKGTGMAALAEILHHRGACISGSDVAEQFFTDGILQRIGIVPRVGFAPDHIAEETQCLIYSAAYDKSNPERQEAMRRGIPQYSYNEVLGMLSRDVKALAVSGVHGKTSTTAMLGMMADRSELPATVIVGSGVAGFGGSATMVGGTDILIAETCEYRRHFLHFHPDVLIVTSVEADHLDYFRDEADVLKAFVEFGTSLPEGGILVYSGDDKGARTVADTLRRNRKDIRFIPYGFTADGAGAVSDYTVRPGVQTFRMKGLMPGGTSPAEGMEWTVRVPGRHMVANAAAALTALHAMTPSCDQKMLEAWKDGLEGFTGTSRRSEVIAEVEGILVLDDYAHHPTAIAATLEGYRQFWPQRRLIVDFMSHTYSRTEALLEGFAAAFGAADIVFLNEIYSSAREERSDTVSGKVLAEAVARHHRDVRFVPTFDEAEKQIMAELRRGDLFVTMGAGDNFRIGRKIVDGLNHRKEAR
jgi:UDP-N-acetylmuramate--alanine ligase